MGCSSLMMQLFNVIFVCLQNILGPFAHDYISLLLKILLNLAITFILLVLAVKYKLLSLPKY